METKFQTSFIPKKNAPQFVAPTRTSTISIAMVVGIAVFVISLSAAGAVFAYKKILIKQIEAKSAELTAKRNELEPEFVELASRLNKRIISAQKIITAHTVVSPVFLLLEDSTLGTVRFDNFTYGLNEDHSAGLSLSGQARSFTAIALQSDIFNQDKRIKNPVFSDLNPNSKGNIVFKFTANILSEAINFKNSLNLSEKTPTN